MCSPGVLVCSFLGMSLSFDITAVLASGTSQKGSPLLCVLEELEGLVLTR